MSLKPVSCLSFLFVSIVAAVPLAAQAPRPNISTPKQVIGFNMGDDYTLANYDQIETYLKKLSTESDRMKLVDIGPTEEGRRQYMVIVSSPENMKKLDHYKEISAKLSHAEGLTDVRRRTRSPRKANPIVWIDGRSARLRNRRPDAARRGHLRTQCVHRSRDDAFPQR